MWLIHQFDTLLHLGDCKEYPIMAKAKTPRTPKNGAAVQTPLVTASETQPEIKELKIALPEARKNVFPINLDEEIRRRAYELWEQRGHEGGHETEHWLLAETEVLSRYSNSRQHSA
jgi:Protein of unknown function (DUF2934)